MRDVIVRNEGKLYVIHYQSLLAIEVSDYLCKFLVGNGNTFSCTESLQKALSELPTYFIRISRNCIINTRHVKAIDFKTREIELSNHAKYHFSVRNAHTLRKMFQK